VVFADNLEMGAGTRTGGTASVVAGLAGRCEVPFGLRPLDDVTLRKVKLNGIVAHLWRAAMEREFVIN